MNTIITKELKDVRYALGSAETAKNRYNQIKGTFPDGNEYKIFAEPIIQGNRFTWVTDYKGVIINYNQLTPQDQSKVKDLLTDQIKKLINASKTYSDTSLTEFLMKCIEIPDLKDIFVIRNNNEDKVVLTQWGFMSDIPGAEKGLLEKIINAKKVQMVFNVVYQDDSIAPDSVIHLEYEGKKEIHKSNQNGQIIIEKVKIDTYVKAYEVENNEQINHHSFICYEFGTYKIVLPLKLDMKFKVIDSNKKILVGERFYFSYKNVEETITSDNDGIMILPKVNVMTEVKVYQLKDNIEENVNRFICEKGKEEYLIIIQVPYIEPVVVEKPVVPVVDPKNYKMRFKVVDDNNQIVVSAEITVKYNGKTAKLFTDEFGYAELEGVEPGTKVNVEAKSEKKK